MKALLRDLEKLMHIKSPAQVAVWLGQKDTRPVYMWLNRQKIPKAKIERVKELLARELAD